MLTCHHQQKWSTVCCYMFIVVIVLRVDTPVRSCVTYSQVFDANAHLGELFICLKSAKYFFGNCSFTRHFLHKKNLDILMETPFQSQVLLVGRAVTHNSDILSNIFPYDSFCTCKQHKPHSFLSFYICQNCMKPSSFIYRYFLTLILVTVSK